LALNRLRQSERARCYGSALGRFTSPDWAASPEPIPYANLNNPQSLNLYAYVQNEPLSAADPDGHRMLGDGYSICVANAYGNGCSSGPDDQYELFESQQAQQQETATGTNGVTTIHHADGSVETRTGGSASWRNHNPGNEGSGYGAIGTAHIKINGKMHTSQFIQMTPLAGRLWIRTCIRSTWIRASQRQWVSLRPRTMEMIPLHTPTH
jgi:RHS repeat-associated protein